MEHFFDLPVTYKDQTLSLRARLVTFGYTYKFFIMVNKYEIQVERDDQMNWRILNYDPEIEIESSLLEAIVASLDKITE